VARLEDLKSGARIQGLAPGGGAARVVNVEWFGDQAVKVIFEDGQGQVRNRLVYRSDEPTLELQGEGSPWAFDGDGSALRLALEAWRIRLAHLFDPYLAVHTSRIEPLPHQITAVYGEMIPRHPLRFLLADDPGAGKTIMTGLLVKELMIRGDIERCLVVAPGNLVEQWQDELSEKFGLTFSILSRDQIEASRTGNPFLDHPLLIARLDMLSRNEELQEKFQAAPSWDLIVCDEAHKMSASHFGTEVKYTKRFLLGRTLGAHCRHLLLLTATPHNGKEDDFQVFLSLLDADRFEGKFRDGVHKTDASDLMRRLVKEEILKFDGSRLFPERLAYTANYKLSNEEAELYAAVTTYVRDEMNRAERFAAKDEKRKINVGFALQTLQRRLASSPEAIYQSLRRRRERLESRVAEEKILQRGNRTATLSTSEELPRVSEDYWEDLDEAPEEELEQQEETVLDQATAAATIAELETEIVTLRGLEEEANRLRRSGTDTKWTELNSILDHPLMTDAHGSRRKLIVFTEPRDTLLYLAERIRNRLGRAEAVEIIHGAISREDRRKAIERFRQDKDVLVLVANDAAGEGVNLQRAHLMVNYDLPWNPNRLEQRFGRIHRIGQDEVCHLWNLVASETREGEVYKRLLDKIETARKALGGRVYDVLGRLFEERPLRELLLEAIRYGDDPATKAKLRQQVENAGELKHIVGLLEDRALTHESMGAEQVARIREDMERAEARRLQPHYIRSFFIEAFRRLGGQIHEREPGRYEVSNVPGPIRDRDRQIGTRAPVLRRYERITFEKHLVREKPEAEFVCPGHPLLDATLDLTLERHGALLKKGALFIDDADAGDSMRILWALEHAIQDGRIDRQGQQQVISQRLQFVEFGADGQTRDGGPAPHLDYRPASEAERELLATHLEAPWLRDDVERHVLGFAIQHLAPSHVEEVKARQLPLIDKIEREVTQRLRAEITHWDNRAQALKAQERAGKQTRLSSANAQARADDLADRLRRRRAQLERQRDISALPPVVRGGAIVAPAGLLRRLRGEAPAPGEAASQEAREEVERLAMEAVIAAERALGFEPRDVSSLKCGYDVESRVSGTGQLRMIEVKGRARGAGTVTVTRNEILVSLNKPDSFILALVEVDGTSATPRYLRQPFQREPDFGATSVNYDLGELLERAEAPS
jgi:SNF2 family DNA or RNA helicase